MAEAVVVGKEKPAQSLAKRGSELHLFGSYNSMGISENLIVKSEQQPLQIPDNSLSLVLIAVIAINSPQSVFCPGIKQ